MNRLRSVGVIPLVILAMLSAPLSGSCPWSYMDCPVCALGLCIDYPSGGVWFAGDAPMVGCLGDPYACVWCQVGCAWCLSIHMVVAAECEGQIGTYEGHICCRDYACCP